jgi:hypothetical protein
MADQKIKAAAVLLAAGAVFSTGTATAGRKRRTPIVALQVAGRLGAHRAAKCR